MMTITHFTPQETADRLCDGLYFDSGEFWNDRAQVVAQRIEADGDVTVMVWVHAYGGQVVHIVKQLCRDILLGDCDA